LLGIFLDTETNGLNTKKHHVIEIAFRIVDTLSGNELDHFESRLFVSYEEWKKSDPVSLKVNGFSWCDVKDSPKHEQVVEEIKAAFSRSKIKRDTAVFICQNPSFDRAFFNQLIDADAQETLGWPYHWLDLASMYWAKCFLKGTNRPSDTGISKNAIARAHHLPEEANPHKAMNGVDHLLLCYRTVVGFPEETT